MTRYQPLWQQAGSYAASQDRSLIGSLWPSGGATGGVVAAVANTMTVTAAPGTVAVPLQSGQGCALCRWDANETPTIATAPPTGNSRIDLVIVQVRDNALDAGANNDFIVTTVTGTPAASNPGVPATPTNAYVLAQVLVPGGAANLNGATVTPAAPGWLRVGAPLGAVVAGASSPAVLFPFATPSVLRPWPLLVRAGMSFGTLSAGKTLVVNFDPFPSTLVSFVAMPTNQSVAPGPVAVDRSAGIGLGQVYVQFNSGSSGQTAEVSFVAVGY